MIIICSFSPAWANSPIAFSRQLNDGRLSIQAPRSYASADKRIFVDDNNGYGVKLRYGGLTVEANQAAFDPRQNIIELPAGFKGAFEGYSLEGAYFRINASTGNFSGRDMKFGYLSAYLHGDQFYYYGDKIAVDGITSAPFDYPLFSIDTGRLEIYPGYALAKNNRLKMFNLPIYYIPLYFNDQRRNYFELPFPALEAKQDIFHGNNAAVHSNYFIDPIFYGDIALHLSDIGGGGVELQQFIRASDHHQFELNYLSWQRSPAQAKLSYVFNAFNDPPRPDHLLSFREKSESISNISRIDSPGVIGYSYSQNEEVNRSLIDRYPDISVSGRLKGLLFDHSYTLAPIISYGRIKEKKIYPENAAPQDVNRDYQRKGIGLNGSYYLETPFIKPYINKALLSLNYQHASYDPGGIDRDRIAGSLTVRRPLLSLNGLYYQFILTKILLDHGQSPFFYEEYGLLKDNGALDIYLESDRLIGGGQFIYDFTNGVQYNEIYYVGVKVWGDSYAVIRHDRRMQFWEFAFMKKELAF